MIIFRLLTKPMRSATVTITISLRLDGTPDSLPRILPRNGRFLLFRKHHLACSIQEGEGEDYEQDEDDGGYYGIFLIVRQAISEPASKLIPSLWQRMLEQGGGRRLFGDPAATSAASDDQIHKTSLGQHQALLNKFESGRTYVNLHCHEIWTTENGTSCVPLASETVELVESDEEPSLPPPLPWEGALTPEAFTSESPREPDDGSHLRESLCVEGVCPVSQGPESSLQVNLFQLPNISPYLPVCYSRHRLPAIGRWQKLVQRSQPRTRSSLRPSGNVQPPEYGVKFGPHPVDV